MRGVTLITGGARSGKSAHALKLAESLAGGGKRKAFIATAEAFDDEMRDRIALHRAERGADWMTIEAPLDLAGAIRELPKDAAVAVADCLTVWLGNQMHHGATDEAIGEAAADLLVALREPPCPLILVTNEVGMGIVPENPLARRFRDEAGRVNQRLAAAADRVILMTCGLPLTIKE